MASRKRQPTGAKLSSKNEMTLRSETSLCSDFTYNQIRVKNKT